MGEGVALVVNQAAGIRRHLMVRPHGGALWGLFLEKAFAKHFGGYHKLAAAMRGETGEAGGTDDAGTLSIFKLCTGGTTYRLKQQNGRVHRHDLSCTAPGVYGLEPTVGAHGSLSYDAAFDTLRTLLQRGVRHHHHLLRLLLLLLVFFSLANVSLKRRN